MKVALKAGVNTEASLGFTCVCSPSGKWRGLLPEAARPPIPPAPADLVPIVPAPAWPLWVLWLGTRGPEGRASVLQEVPLKCELNSHVRPGGVEDG